MITGQSIIIMNSDLHQLIDIARGLAGPWAMDATTAACRRLLAFLRAIAHKRHMGDVFERPGQDDRFPGYSDVVKTPIDLQAIEVCPWGV